jgi:hypothetical protein
MKVSVTKTALELNAGDVHKMTEKFIQIRIMTISKTVKTSFTTKMKEIFLVSMIMNQKEKVF